MINLLINVFGIDLTVAEIAVILSIIGAIITFLIWYKPEKIKRFAEARMQNFKVIQTPADRELWFQEQYKKWIKELREIQDEHDKAIKTRDGEIKTLLKDKIDSLKIHDEMVKGADGERAARQKLMTRLGYAYWETDAEGKLVAANGAWLELFGLQRGEALGEGWVESIHADDKKRVVVEWYAALADLNDNEPIDFKVENPATGETVSLSAVFSICKDASGNAAKCFGVTMKK